MVNPYCMVDWNRFTDLFPNLSSPFLSDVLIATAIGEYTIY